MAAILLLFVFRPAHGAGSLPAGFAQSRVAGGLSNPTAMAFAPDGRLFVAEQGGKLRVIENGALLSEPFVSLNVDSRGERGLLGVALDPNFSANGYVYLYYTTRLAPIHNRVVRFTAVGNQAAPGSYRLIFRLNKLSRATNHNGGAIHFGRYGKLYVAVGDNANGENAQSLKNPKGKMLRIGRNGGIPGTNPFFRKAEGKNRAIWALGFRNPFSFAVQPGTGRIFVNDVGQQRWEEINRLARGANYGWPRYEGPESNRRFRPPLFAYRHDGDPARTGCAITGGTFYNPGSAQFPSGYVGDYFFADFCNGWIRRYDPAADHVAPFASDLSFPVDLQVGPDGSLYYLERGTGSVNKVSYTP